MRLIPVLRRPRVHRQRHRHRDRRHRRILHHRADDGDCAFGLALWLRYGVNRILCFLSTVLALSFVVSFFRIDDALALPLPLSCRKSLILGESLFNTARGALDDSDLYLRHVPDQRILPDRWPARAFAAFQRQLLIILTLIFYILNEAEIQGELIDNRIAHCINSE